MADINDLRRDRVKAVNDARALLDKAEAEKRDFTAEEQTIYDRAMADVDRLAKRIADMEKLASVPTDLPTEPRAGKPDNAETPEQRKERQDAEHRAAWSAHLVPQSWRTAEEQRALAAYSDTAGGYITVPPQFVNELIKGVDNDVFMQRICRVIRTRGGAAAFAPSLDNDPADPTWTTELLIGSEDSTMSFGKRELKAHPAAQYIKVSKTLLRNGAMSPEMIVQERLRYKMSVVRENAFMNGTGASQPLGMFVASASGINTDRDISTGNTDTSILTDGLIEAQHKLDVKYRNRAVWVFHDDAVKQIRKLKDGEGRYIWAPGISSSQPDQIFNRPVYTSAYAPNTFTTGLYVGMFFVPEYYWILEDLEYEIQRLDELYAATNQVGYINRSQADGMPVLSEAFARVKLA